MLGHADYHSQLVADDGRSFPVALGRSTVGREVDCQMRLTDPTVGRHHAAPDASPTSVTVTDLQSTNGTWVNDRRVGATDLVALRHGDILRLGATRLHFVEPATATGVEYTAVMHSGPPSRPQPLTPVQMFTVTGLGVTGRLRQSRCGNPSVQVRRYSTNCGCSTSRTSTLENPASAA